MGLLRLPKRLKRGERLPAAWCNDVIAALATLSGLRVEHPLRMVAGDGGIVIRFEGRGPARRYEARIAAVSGGGGPAVPATFTYSVVIPDVPELGTLTGLTPEFRPGEPDLEITPAAVGDHCNIVERLDGAGVRKWELELHAGSEKVYFDACAEPRPAGIEASSQQGIEGEALARRIADLEAQMRGVAAAQIELLERVEKAELGGGT